MIVLVDMDGPLADFDRHYWDTTVDLHGHVFDVATLADTRHRFISDHLPPSVARQMRKIVNELGWFADLPPVPGAAEGLKALAAHPGAEVWICSKPLEANPTCRDDKAAWLDEHMGDGWSRRLILAPDKSLIQGGILIDDAIKPDWTARASWTPVVYPMPWNRPGTKHGQCWPRWDWSRPVTELPHMGGPP